MSDFESADESAAGAGTTRRNSNAFAEFSPPPPPAAAEKKGTGAAASGGSGKGGQDTQGLFPGRRRGTGTGARRVRSEGRAIRRGESVLWNMFASITSVTRRRGAKPSGNEPNSTPRGAPAGRLAAQGAIDGVARRGAFGSSVPRASKPGASLRRRTASIRWGGGEPTQSAEDTARSGRRSRTREPPGTPSERSRRPLEKRERCRRSSEPKASEGDAVTAGKPLPRPSRPAPASDETDVEAGVVPESSRKRRPRSLSFDRRSFCARGRQGGERDGRRGAG